MRRCFLCLLLLMIGSVAALGGPADAYAGIAVPRSPGRLLGQRIMVGFPGTRPTRSLLSRVRTGQVGAVILFSDNIADDSQVRSLTGALQRAARAGGNPPL